MITHITLETALQRASSALREKMQHSVELLRKAEHLALTYDNRGGYYLAFSGGKDSQALYHIAELAGVQFEAHMNLTSVDPPEVIRFVKQAYPEVELIKPHDSIFNIAVKRQILPTMRVRWCCAEYKETAGAGKVTLIGIRHEESSRRARRNEVEINSRKFSGTLEQLDKYRLEQNEKAKKPRKGRKPKGEPLSIVTANGERVLGCIHGKESLLISPIIHWTEKDVWEFLNVVMQVPHCSLYDEGWTRLGCIGCPMSSQKQKRIENARYPHVKRNWIKAIKAIRRGGGIQRRIYLVEHQSGLDSLKQQRITQDQSGWIQHPKQEHWQGSSTEKNMGEPTTECGTKSGFSQSSSPDCLTEEQKEDLIAENIYDWWISGKSYKQWYAEKFLQQKLNFEE